MSSAIAPSDPRARLRAANARVTELRARGAELLYDLGLVLREVAEEQLWRAGGHESFADWLEDEAEVSRTTALRCIDVVRHFNRDLCARYGFDKLAAGLRYMAATRRLEEPGDLIAADLTLRGEGGRFTSVPFHEATVREVQDATNLLLSSRRASLGGADADSLEERLQLLAAALPDVPDGMKPAQQRVRLTRGRGGVVTVSIQQIPFTDEGLSALIDALERARLR